MKKLALILGFLVIALVLACGCTTTSTSSSSSSLSITLPSEVVITGTWEINKEDLSSNPMPIEIELDAINQGKSDAKNVQADIVFTYDDKTILTEKADIGDISAGNSKEFKAKYMLDIPETFD
ncbi:MAG: hypothetical protein II861_00075, partial [Methanomicrobium sp.]|nr:hypothetical protein [Methanomicrobium sp.]